MGPYEAENGHREPIARTNCLLHINLFMPHGILQLDSTLPQGHYPQDQRPEFYLFCQRDEQVRNNISKATGVKEETQEARSNTSGMVGTLPEEPLNTVQKCYLYVYPITSTSTM